jgi:hypothetical protein
MVFAIKGRKTPLPNGEAAVSACIAFWSSIMAIEGCEARAPTDVRNPHPRGGEGGPP